MVGTDAASFDIDTATGQLMTLAALDYETKATYEVMVTATDPDSASDMITVTITVTNVDEMGEVTLWAGADALTMAPQVGDTITGAVMDPDGGVTGETWQWARTMDTADMNSWMPITGATAAAYMVTEGDTGYHLRVMATYTDAAGTDMAMEYSPATMMVTAMMTVPMFDSETATREVAENTEAGMDIGDPVMGTDADGDTLAYTLVGTDAASFDIDPETGQLMTLAALDYETKATYEVMVTATDPDSASDMITVTITVTNVDEMGEVTLWAGVDALTMAPQVGDTITGAVMDPDGGVTGETWQWAKTMDAGHDGELDGNHRRNRRRVHGDGRRRRLLPAGDGDVHGRGGHGHGHGVLAGDHDGDRHDDRSHVRLRDRHKRSRGEHGGGHGHRRPRDGHGR